MKILKQSDIKKFQPTETLVFYNVKFDYLEALDVQLISHIFAINPNYLKKHHMYYVGTL